MAFKTLTGLWLSDDRKYMSGKSKDEIVIPAGVKVFVFGNDKRESDKHPTHRLCISVPDDDHSGEEPGF